MSLTQLLNKLQESGVVSKKDLTDTLKKLKNTENEFTGSLITSGEAFDNTYKDFKEALDSGEDEKGNNLLAIVDRDIHDNENGIGISEHALVFSNTLQDTVVIRANDANLHFTLKQVDSLVEALTMAKQAVLDSKGTPIKS